MNVFMVLKAKRLLLWALAGGILLFALAYGWQAGVAPVFWGRAKEVYLMGHTLDPSAPDLKEQVAALAASLEQAPIDAVYDSVNESAVPGVNGFRLDVDETVSRVKSARNKTNVMPAWHETAPEQSLADFPTLPVYCGNPVKNQVALVVNVSWGNEYLVEMLAIFEEEKVTASFFLVGRWAEENPDLVDAIVAAGHELANHGYSDAHLQELSPDAIKTEILQTNQVIAELYGRELQWFSPPYGEKETKIYEAAAELNMTTVLWSLDTIDWQLPGEEAIIERIVDNIHHGAIVLMHPTEQTPGALRPIIAGIRRKKLQLVTVGQLLDASYWPQHYSHLWLGN